MIESQTKRTRFTTNIALISIFSALWVVLNFTLAPLGFSLTGLPIIHSVIIFFMLILVTWATNQYGAASLVGIVGSVLVLLAGGPLPVLGFVPASLLFDLILIVNHHKLDMKLTNLAIAVLGAIASSYFAGVVNGIFILSFTPTFALTIWGGWNIVGGVIGVALALPIVGALEKAHVKKVKTA